MLVKQKTVRHPDAVLNVYALQRRSTAMIPTGFELAREQFGPDTIAVRRIRQNEGELKIDRNADRIRCTSGKIEIVFDLKAGRFTSYTYAGEAFLEEFPEPYFWRAPTDNDFGCDFQNYAGIWRNAHLNRRLQSVKVGDQNDEGLPITVVFRYTDIRADYTLRYLIQNNGAVRVEGALELGADSELPELPRFGMRCRVKRSLDELIWYGRGPGENYPDRKTASFLGLYHGNVGSQFTKTYVRPQENGYHTDTRYLTLGDSYYHALTVTGLQPFCFSALPYLDEDLDEGTVKKNRHPSDLVERPFTNLHIDLTQRGVGGDDSWGAQPHREYRLFEKKYSFGFVIGMDFSGE